MERHELEQAATPEQLAAALDLYREDLARLHHMHDHPNESIREATYKGHTIRVKTTYEIDVDGAPITGHLLLSNARTIHYHAIPNQEFASAIDMVKRIIDLLPAGLSPPPPSPGPTDPMAGPDHHPGA